MVDGAIGASPQRNNPQGLDLTWPEFFFRERLAAQFALPNAAAPTAGLAERARRGSM